MNALAICLLGLGSGFLGGLLAWWLARWFAKPEEAVLTTDRLDPAINWDDFSGRQVLHREVRGRDGKMHAVELVDPNAGLPEYER